MRDWTILVIAGMVLGFIVGVIDVTERKRIRVWFKQCEELKIDAGECSKQWLLK